MLNISLDTNIKDVEKYLTATEKKVIPRATARTLNRLGDSAGKTVRQFVSKESGVSQADLKKRGISARFRATAKKPIYTILVRYQPIPLKDFKPKQIKVGVSARAWGKNKKYKNAFISQKLGGHVFVRQGRGRLPIKKLWGSIPSRIADSRELDHKIARMVRQRFGKELVNNIKFYSKR